MGSSLVQTMDSLLSDVVAVRAGSLSLLEKLDGKHEGEDYRRTRSAIHSLVGALAADFETPLLHQRKSCAESSDASVAKSRKVMQNQLSREKSARQRAEENIESMMVQRVGCHIQDMWYVRVGLAPPTRPVRTLAAFCRDFPDKECANISKSRVGAVRDTFVQIIKGINRRMLAQTMAGPKHPRSIFMLHVHDEAVMRTKSFAAEHDATYSLASHNVRGRTSKIQNNFVALETDGVRLEWFTELQPLLRKDGNSIAWALRLVWARGSAAVWVCVVCLAWSAPRESEDPKAFGLGSVLPVYLPGPHVGAACSR